MVWRGDKDDDIEDIIFKPNEFTVSHIVNQNIFVRYQGELSTIHYVVDHYELNINGLIYCFEPNTNLSSGSVINLNLTSVTSSEHIDNVEIGGMLFTKYAQFTGRHAKEGQVFFNETIQNTRVIYVLVGEKLLLIQEGPDGKYVEIPGSDLIYIMQEDGPDKFMTVRFLPSYSTSKNEA